MTDFHALPQQPSDEDRFADALDAISLGMPLKGSGSDPLANLAATLQGIGASPATADDVSNAPKLDRTSKSRIWADLMTEHGGADTRRATPQTPGAAGSVLSLNPWVAETEPAQTKRARSSSGVLRFIPTAQPTSTFLLIVAVLALVGATFAGLSPNGGRGGIPTARATEDPAHLDFASPEASPSNAISETSNFCIGQPTGSSNDELREMSIDDWLFPSSFPADEAEPAVAKAMHDAYISYHQCLAQPAILEDPHVSDPEAVASYLSDRNRFTLLYDELDQEQQAGIDEYACLP